MKNIPVSSFVAPSSVCPTCRKSKGKQNIKDIFFSIAKNIGDLIIITMKLIEKLF